MDSSLSDIPRFQIWLIEFTMIPSGTHMYFNILEDTFALTPNPQGGAHYRYQKDAQAQLDTLLELNPEFKTVFKKIQVVGWKALLKQ